VSAAGKADLVVTAWTPRQCPHRAGQISAGPGLSTLAVR